MTIQEEMELEEIAMNNAYDIIVGDKCMDDLIDRGDKYVALPFDIDGDWDVENVLSDCMSYFVMVEDYEKCATIKEVLNELKLLKDAE
tara:strand:- start:317 stop:580 length:264 start_codon:yes stop_codon:yes gene_type:complete